jgi:hypothetical protein
MLFALRLRLASRRDRMIADAWQRSGRPGGSRCGPHRPGPQWVVRPRSPSTEYLLLSKPTGQALEPRPARHGNHLTDPHKVRAHELGSLGLEDLPDRPVGELRMPMRLGVGNAFIEQSGIQLIARLESQPQAEESFGDQSNLVLDLGLVTFGPTHRHLCSRPARAMRPPAFST